ncbi:MAG: 4Fe-4S binding protein [Burkholderiaceae bacterium]|nr:4Fe-4S binding protein [Burkholderiaceae bacterium]
MKTDPESPKGRALAAIADLAPEPTGLVEYRSRGEVLVIGPPLAADRARERLMASAADRLRVRALHVPGGDAPGGHGRSRAGLSLSGHLGAFRLADGDETVEGADIVLDLCQPALLSMPLPPFGYLAPGTDSDALEQAVAEIPTLVGQFEKPQFFGYASDLCAHGASGIEGCRRCIDACPALAIRSIGERISVDPYLCQGGGACASVCPSGAITYRYPPAADTLTRLRRMLHAYREAGGDRATVLLHRADGAPEFDGSDLLPLALEELASAGLEIWLGAIAYGAAAVRLWRDDTIAPATIALLDAQREVANTILRSLGFPAAVQWQDRNAGPETMPRIAAATYGATGGKRQALFAAIDHLASAASRPPPLAGLPVDAPLGRVIVDVDACTLCLACASVCPAGALGDGGSRPALRFFESKCLQCGLCQKACPENAIRLEPRIVFDPRRRREAVALKEEAPFDCIRCGKPFATRSALERVLAKLEGHPMFRDEAARRRLKMCEDCRVLDMMQDNDG